MVGQHLQYQTIDVDLVSPVLDSTDELTSLLSDTPKKGNLFVHFFLIALLLLNQVYIPRV